MSKKGIITWPAITEKTKRRVRFFYASVLLFFAVGASVVLIAIEAKKYVFEHSYLEYRSAADEAVPLMQPFPIGVFPDERRITENPRANTYLSSHIATANTKRHQEKNWFGRAVSKLAQHGWFQNLASPGSRILVILPGERREEIALNFGEILGWNREERAFFMEQVASSSPELFDGKFFYGTYIVQKDAEPKTVATMLLRRFESEVLARYTEDIAKEVPLADALTLASLLEREAYDFEDMRAISGVIWNRLFIDMPLQIDATLQYVKGSNLYQPWWPAVRPADKFLPSPYNTYENKGLPPTPINTPSLDAIVAALNPKKTDCMFYFHDSDGGFHCSATYDDHVAGLKREYGRGR